MQRIMTGAYLMLSSINNKYLRQVILYGIPSLLLAGVIAGGFFGYRYWQRSVDAQASRVLIDGLLDFQGAVQALGNKEVPEKDLRQHLENIELEMRNSYKQYSSSSLAPFFLACRAQVLGLLGQHEEAYTVAKQAYPQFDRTSPYYMMFAVQAAHRAMDLPDKVQEGVALLEELAQSNHPEKIMAQYYLAEYYLAHQRVEEGKKLLDEIIKEAQEHAAEGVSPYAQLAGAKRAVLL